MGGFEQLFFLLMATAVGEGATQIPVGPMGYGCDCLRTLRGLSDKKCVWESLFLAFNVCGYRLFPSGIAYFIRRALNPPFVGTYVVDAFALSV